MSLIEKLRNLFTEADDYYGNEDDKDEYDDAEPEPVKKEKPVKEKKAKEKGNVGQSQENNDGAFGKTVSFDFTSNRGSGNYSYNRNSHDRSANRSSNMEVRVFKPTSVEEEKDIADALKQGDPVFLDITGLNSDIAQRIIDFLAGTIYSIDGKLMKVSNFTYIAAPDKVNISGDTEDLMDGSGFGGPKI